MSKTDSVDFAAIRNEFRKITDFNDIKLINEMLRTYASSVQRANALSFYRGQKVQFKSRTGELVNGRVDRINQKTVSLTTTDGRIWKVSPSLLRAA